MTRAEFVTLAAQIAGPRWKTRLGPMIGRSRKRVWEYANDVRAVPVPVAKLMELMAKGAVDAD